MAGEIQIGGTTFATESGGTVTVSNVDSATNRTNLGLGSMATQNANAVAITGGSVSGASIVPTSPFSFRNLLINGSLDIWQRGTTNASVSNNYLADRFWTASTSSTDQSTDAPDGFNYSIKLTYGSTDMAIGQPIELFKTGSSKPFVAGETVTLSYYAKVDSGTEGISSNIHFRDSKFSATNQSSFTYSNNVQTLTTSWQRFSMQFTVPSVNGTNVMALLEIAGISKTAYFTGFQLEKGSVATPFEHRPNELSLCQRYFQKTYNTDVAPGTVTDLGASISRASASSNIYYGELQRHTQVMMRATPEVKVYSTATGTVDKVRVGSSDVSITAINDEGAGSFGYPQLASAPSSGDDIRCHYTAAAEL